MKTAQDYIQGGGYALGGFNRRIFGYTYLEAFKYENEQQNGELHAGWDLADSMIEQGKIYFVHNFHRLECPNGHAFHYGGSWVCNTCNNSGVDRDWWKIKVAKDGNAWCCVGEGFENLQESDNYAFGDTRDEAILAYGYLMTATTEG